MAESPRDGSKTPGGTLWQKSNRSEYARKRNLTQSRSAAREILIGGARFPVDDAALGVGTRIWHIDAQSRNRILT
jgi:hypothetical protein